MKSTFYALCAASTLALATPAFAAGETVHVGSDTLLAGQTTTINFDGNVNQTTINGLSASLQLTFFNIVGGDYVFNYTLTNTSTSPITASRVSGLAFNSNPDVVGGSASGVFTNLITSGAFPNGVKDVEVCFQDGGASCQGGGNGGVTFGQSATGTFTLDFGATTPTSITLSDFFVRYQAINGPGMNGASGTGGQVPGVPEPAAWAMMLLGFAGIGMTIRRRRNSQVLAQVA